MLFNIRLHLKDKDLDSKSYVSDNTLHKYVKDINNNYDLTRLAKSIICSIEQICGSQNVNIDCSEITFDSSFVFMIYFYMRINNIKNKIFYCGNEIKNMISDKFDGMFDLFDQYMKCVDSRNSTMNMGGYCNIIEYYLEKYNIRHEKIICDVNSRFNMIYSVGKGSKFAPTLYVISFADKSILDTKSYCFDNCFVGKGVVYDTGGLGIKPARYMLDMHIDMAGSALVFFSCLFSYLIYGVNSLCVIPIVENMVDGNSYLNGDILNSYCGKKVHVRHTDAEGRLILGDSVSYVSRNHSYKDMHVFCTLTGAASIVSGGDVCVCMSDNKDTMYKIKRNMDKSGETMIELPMYSIYEEYITDEQKVYGSKIDIHNASKDKGASCITAAKFIEFFADKTNHKSYSHYDIANYYESHITSSSNLSMSNLFLFASSILAGDCCFPNNFVKNK